jgi:hypothetical protein
LPKDGKLNLKVSYTSKKFTNDLKKTSLLLCPELRDYNSVIFYIILHHNFFISTLAKQLFLKKHKTNPENCPILQ